MFDLTPHSSTCFVGHNTGGHHGESAFALKVINFAAENNSYRLICNSGNLNGCKQHCKMQFGRADQALAADECSKAVTEAYAGGMLGGAACFPLHSVVTRREDGIIPLSKLRIGDEILVPTDSGVGFDSVIGFLHRDETTAVRFLSVGFGAGKLNIHPDHLVPVIIDGGSKRFKKASELIVSDRIESLWIDGSVVVTEVQSLDSFEDRGLVCPVTRSGLIIVDSVVCSCYSVPTGIVPFAISHGMCHALMAPLRLSYDINMSRMKGEKPVTGINSYAKMLMSLATGVIFA
jgi:hypothetical protein